MKTESFADTLFNYRLSAGAKGVRVNQKTMVEILNKRLKNPLLVVNQKKYHMWENGKQIPRDAVRNAVLKVLTKNT